MRRRSMRLLAAVALALTTMVVGFAHRPLDLEARGYGVDVAAFVLPDGSLPGLCLFDDRFGHGDHGGAATKPCDACRLSAAPGLGAIAEFGIPVPVEHSLGRVAMVVRAIDGVVGTTARARGPPEAA